MRQDIESFADGTDIMLKRKKLTIGWRETAALPDMGLMQFAAKIDTGARTTALHAACIKDFMAEGKHFVEFLPDHPSLGGGKLQVAKVLAKRAITNTSGIPEPRFIIATTLRIGSREARVEISLTDRVEMAFPMIVGRTALRQLGLIVDPARSWRVSEKPQEQKKEN